MAKYTIFGGGPSGLYSAWRLLQSDTLTPEDSIEIVEWGDYDYNNDGAGTRLPAGRICTYHYDNDPNQSYIEIGGMRYIDWNGDTKEGHQLVSKTIQLLGLDNNRVDFNTTSDPLLFLRGELMYQSDITDANPAPYNTFGDQNQDAADALISAVSNAIIGGQASSRVEQCQFYATGTLPEGFSSQIYPVGTLASNIGYWNVLYDQVFNEGYQYASDAGGYTSNVINWNAANAAVYNGEFAPGGAFKTLRTGFSSIFTTMYQQCIELASSSGVGFQVTANTRLHSIWDQQGEIEYYVASANNPKQPEGDSKTTDYAILAMPPHAIKIVASATRFLPAQSGRTYFLNDNSVETYLQSVIEQPSYKVAMFFDSQWWSDPDITSQMPKPPKVNTDNNTFGPTITDLPIRQIYYFGNNAPGAPQNPVTYGILASYDDMRFTKFWEEMELSLVEQHTTPPSDNLQPLIGAGEAPPSMIDMLRLELVRVHFGQDATDIDLIPAPIQTRFMNWGRNPFGAGYHAWASHYNICDVMQKIRTPGRMAGLSNSCVFIVGSAFSNDQAWIEGAFCTAESVLTQYLGVQTIATDPNEYPLICGGS